MTTTSLSGLIGRRARPICNGDAHEIVHVTVEPADGDDGPTLFVWLLDGQGALRRVRADGIQVLDLAAWMRPPSLPEEPELGLDVRPHLPADQPMKLPDSLTMKLLDIRWDRDNSETSSTLRCPCGARFTWSAVSPDLRPWVDTHYPHLDRSTPADLLRRMGISGQRWAEEFMRVGAVEIVRNILDHVHGRPTSEELDVAPDAIVKAAIRYVAMGNTPDPEICKAVTAYCKEKGIPVRW